MTEQFLSIGIVGVVASLFIEFINRKFGLDSSAAKAVTFLVAIALGAGLFFLQGTEVLEAIIGVLGVSSAVYAFVFKSTK